MNDATPAAVTMAAAPIAATPAASNIPEYSVSELSGAVKRAIEGAFGRIRVRGEVTECRPYPSGHIYLSLKDEGGKVSAVIWKSTLARLGLQPENGVEVIATGRLTTYGERSTYQLVIERLEYAGEGALLARIEMLRKRLAAEGLFDAARKRRWPLLPAVVGVVTSERGAVIRDIVTTIERRFPRRVLLWPVPVQGPDAAARIAAAIEGFGRLSPGGAPPRPDVLIVARGGGSLEDLMAFNEEIVVRAAAASPIPLISAVGHETDTTLIDHAADMRAPTPTAAAELAVPERRALAADLVQLAARLAGASGQTLQRDRLLLERVARGLPDLPGLLGTARQRLDDRAHRMALALPNLLAARRAALLRAERGLPDPAGLVRHARQELLGLAVRLPVAVPALLARRREGLTLAAVHLRSALRHAVARKAAVAAEVLPRLSPNLPGARLREAAARLEGLAARLESVSHRAVLARGYAAVFDSAGRPVTAAASVRPGGALRISFQDGDVAVRATRPPAEARQTTLL
jgi:exodeoxyribonuclease VII large subunit